MAVLAQNPVKVVVYYQDVSLPLDTPQVLDKTDTEFDINTANCE